MILTFAAPIFLVLAKSVALPSVPTTENPPGVFAVAEFPQSGEPSGIKGYVVLTSTNAISANVHVDLVGLPEEMGPFAYHIHEFPVGANGDCGASGGVFDPYESEGACSASDAYQCPVGDLAGKHGLITGNEYETDYIDPFLSLNPTSRNFVVGRALVIHSVDGKPFACDTIKVAGDEQLARIRTYMNERLVDNEQETEAILPDGMGEEEMGDDRPTPDDGPTPILNTKTKLSPKKSIIITATEIVDTTEIKMTKTTAVTKTEGGSTETITITKTKAGGVITITTTETEASEVTTTTTTELEAGGIVTTTTTETETGGVTVTTTETATGLVTTTTTETKTGEVTITETETDVVTNTETETGEVIITTTEIETDKVTTTEIETDKVTTTTTETGATRTAVPSEVTTKTITEYTTETEDVLESDIVATVYEDEVMETYVSHSSEIEKSSSKADGASTSEPTLIPDTTQEWGPVPEKTPEPTSQPATELTKHTIPRRSARGKTYDNAYFGDMPSSANPALMTTANMTVPASDGHSKNTRFESPLLNILEHLNATWSQFRDNRTHGDTSHHSRGSEGSIMRASSIVAIGAVLGYLL